MVTIVSRGDGSRSEREGALPALHRLCHDVRQELAVVQALVEIAAREPGMPEQSLRRLDQISAQTSYVAEMMRQVVERTASFSELNVAEFIARVVADVQLRTGSACHLQAVPCSLVADPVLLRRAVVNLLDNAVRAAGPRGSVYVRACPEGDDVLIEIEDNGPGFGLTRPGLGSLGLDVVHDCAQVHGGEVGTGAGSFGGAFVRLRLPQVPSWRLAAAPGH